MLTDLGEACSMGFREPEQRDSTELARGRAPNHSPRIH